VDFFKTAITQDWAIDLNNGVKNLGFHMANHNCPIHIFNATIRVNLFGYKDVFLASIMQVKGQCFVAIDIFIIELQKQFLNFELMNDLNIEYPQFGCNLMPISFSPCILLSLKNTHYEANKM
jgi:hypothetical protein